jgi:hypothetical protein
MWLIILSDQLTIVALVGLYPTNKLIVRRLLHRRLAPLTLRCHAVLAAVSRCYPPPMDRYLRVTHPSATTAETVVRLACVKHAASVRSEPGSNSQVHLINRTFARQNQRTRPPNLSKHRHPTRSDDQISSACVSISRYTNNTPQTKRSARESQNPKPNIPFHQSSALLQTTRGAPPTYPFHSRCNFQRTTGFLQSRVSSVSVDGHRGPTCYEAWTLLEWLGCGISPCFWT